VIAGALGLGVVGLGAAASFAVFQFSGPKGPPAWFPTAGQLGLVLGGMWLYATALGAAGAAFGARKAQAS
jgi:hypothetical protein